MRENRHFRISSNAPEMYTEMTFRSWINTVIFHTTELMDTPRETLKASKEKAATASGAMSGCRPLKRLKAMKMARRCMYVVSNWKLMLVGQRW